MNLSIRNKVVWLAPERCATKITKKIFESYDFYSLRTSDNGALSNFREKEHSHQNIIPEDYKNLPKIVSVRNPYDLTFSIYINKYLKHPLTKNSTDVKENFNSWVGKSFLNHGYEVFMCPFYRTDNSSFNKWRFNDDSHFDYVIRMENLYEDLIKLPFISQENDETKEKIKNIVGDNPYINKRYFTFNKLYDIRSAKLVYHFFKPFFFKFGYSPYSFTENRMSEEEKVSFVHGSID